MCVLPGVAARTFPACAPTCHADLYVMKRLKVASGASLIAFDAGSHDVGRRKRSAITRGSPTAATLRAVLRGLSACEVERSEELVSIPNDSRVGLTTVLRGDPLGNKHTVEATDSHRCCFSERKCPAGDAYREPPIGEVAPAAARYESAGQLHLWLAS